MTIQEYVEAVNKRFKAGISTEHSYRGDLQSLLKALVPNVDVTNEPQRIDCGAPDYILTRKGIPVGYIEAKDIGKSLDSKHYNEQFERYRSSLSNLIITDYLDFRLYLDGVFTTAIVLAEIEKGKIVARPENFAAFIDLIQEFSRYAGQTITSASKLSKMMAGKARLLADVIEKALSSTIGETNSVLREANNSLKEQLEGFREVLIHDITPKQFADIYSQTIAYGMFAARLHDPTIEDFNRKEAAELIPRTNPFLRKLFQYIAGYDLDSRIVWIVDALADLFKATDVAALLKDFGKATQQHDPIIHFYETFLAEYDPALRKSRGVWYTPEPVVNFIVRAVDDMLKTEFGLKDGLADTSKTTVDIKRATTDKRSKDGYTTQQIEVHKVQMLDPATGTGTFLAEIIKHIHNQFEGQQGIWSNYVEAHLIPRLNGFEILMASYAMAHLKLDLLLAETGYKPTVEQRFRVFLTNSLEEHHRETGTLFASWLSQEANEANYIKRDTPVMVVMGNPPYSGHSSNKGEWIEKLLEDYKQEPGGGKLQEKNPKWLNDDYVKFIRYGQHFVEKNGEGVLAFINNHSFLDNPTFRGMRWNLLSTFDKIYIIDLHGNSKKKEACPDGSADKNVFDIQQGVSINLFVKTGKKRKGELAELMHYDLYGERVFKYDFLWKNTLATIGFTALGLSSPQYLFIQKDLNGQQKYSEGFAVNELYTINSMGIATARDEFTIKHKPDEVQRTIVEFLSIDFESARTRFKLGKDARDWKVEFAKTDLLKSGPDFSNIVPICYRPFDNRYTFYTGRSKGFLCMPRHEIMRNLLNHNVAISLIRRSRANFFITPFIIDHIVDKSISSSLDNANIFPLYLYPESERQIILDGKQERTPNLNRAIVDEIAVLIGLTFTPEKEDTPATFAPIDLLDYIYAVLHSPNYREKYKEFLKIDFPRVPYPKTSETFWQLAALGCELRQLHLLESPAVDQRLTSYPVSGDNIVKKLKYQDGKVCINESQYFDGVPLVAWEFYIGGYQPAQKWLKDRNGKALSFEDVRHYQRIIVALCETDRIMKVIDILDVE
ncbi:MAG: DNA methyltransferase [Chlorobiaceae bacterium]|nr:DNA methyltransferase [Chlorobiaceae bacterium]